MYERYTDRARKVMQLANQEAQRFNHEYVDTEHVLLGLMREGSGVAANVLKNLDVDFRKVREGVENLVQSGPDMVTMGKLPQTPRAKKIDEYAREEARNLNHNYVGTEHLLIGLVREPEGVAVQVLMNLGLKLEDVRRETLYLLGHGKEKESKETKPEQISDYWPIPKSQMNLLEVLQAHGFPSALIPNSRDDYDVFWGQGVQVGTIKGFSTNPREGTKRVICYDINNLSQIGDALRLRGIYDIAKVQYEESPPVAQVLGALQSQRTRADSLIQRLQKKDQSPP